MSIGHTERYQINAASYCVLENNNKVLLLKRKNTGYFDRSYGLPSGHLEIGEYPLNSIIREVKEEVGVTIKNPQYFCTIFNTTLGEPHYVCFFFKTDEWDGDVKNCEEEKCDDMQWYSLGELPTNLVPEVRQALENYKTGNLYSEI